MTYFSFFICSLRVFKKVANEEKREDFYIRPAAEYHGGGYLEDPADFSKFCGYPGYVS